MHNLKKFLNKTAMYHVKMGLLIKTFAGRLAFLILTTLTLVSGLNVRLQLEQEALGQAYIRETASEICIGNRLFEIGFRKDTGAFWSLIHKKSGIDLRGVKTDPGEFLWDLRLITEDLRHIGPSGIRRSHPFYQGYAVNRSDNKVCLTFYWSKIGLEEYGEYPASVKVYVVVDDSPLARLSIEIRNMGPAALEDITFPGIIEVSKLGKYFEDDFLVVPDQNGRLFNNPIINLGWWGQDYPSGFLNMQFMAYYDREAGFYIATYDKDGYEKSFYFGTSSDKPDRAMIGLIHRQAISFGRDLNLPYDVVLGVFEGDWHTAADLYQKWAKDQWWCMQKSMPSWLTSIAVSKDVYLYGRGGETNNTFVKGIDYVKQHQNYFRLPTLVLIWGWEKKGAWSSGEYFPPHEEWENFDKMIQEIHRLGFKTWIFISANSIITESEQWRNGSAKSYARLNADGTYQISSGPGWVWEPVEMCPHTDYWKNMLKSCVLTLAEHGVDLIQFDGFPWCGPSKCYNVSHNHPPGRGGNFWVKRWISILSEIEQEARRINPEIAFAGEGGAEIFIPFLDVFHSRDSWSLEIEYAEIAEKGASVIPLFRYVYSERPVMIGQHNPSLTDFLGGSSHNALGFARILTWGEIGSYNFQASMSDPHLDKPLINYLKRISEARATYARSFLLNSTMVKPQEISSPKISVETERQGIFDENAVQYSAWRSANGCIGYILTNIWNKGCTVKVNLNLTEYGLTKPCSAYYIKNVKYYDLGVVSGIFNSTFSIEPLEILLIAFSQESLSYNYTIRVEGLSDASISICLDNRTLAILSGGQSYKIKNFAGFHIVSVDSTRISKDFFTDYVFEGWEADGEMVSTSPIYSFIANKPTILVARWKTELNIAKAGTIILITIVIITVLLMVMRRKHASKSS